MNSVTLEKVEIKKIEKKMLEARLFTLQLADFIVIIETSAMQRIMQTSGRHQVRFYISMS